MPWPKGMPRTQAKGSVQDSPPASETAGDVLSRSTEEGEASPPAEPATFTLSPDDLVQSDVSDEHEQAFIAFWEKVTGGTATPGPEGLLLVAGAPQVSPFPEPVTGPAVSASGALLITLSVDGAMPGQAERLRVRLQGALDSEAKRYRKFPNRRIW